MKDLWFLLIIVLITIIPQILVKSTYRKYASISVNCAKNGEEIAREMLRDNGVNNVSIKRIGGVLTDNYNSKDNTIYLSSSNFNNPSVASIAVAAHETGHAIQQDNSYLFLKIRQALCPVTIISSKLSWVAIYLGFIFYFTPLIWLGTIFLGVIVLFDLVTLPVEINASRRAKRYLVSCGYFDGEEVRGASKVLIAAAFTYVAATLAGLLQLIRIVSRIRRN